MHRGVGKLSARSVEAFSLEAIMSGVYEDPLTEKVVKGFRTTLFQSTVLSVRSPMIESFVWKYDNFVITHLH